MLKCKRYYQLTKPGIVYGNIVSAVGGFLLASRWHFNPWLLLATLSGTAFVIASGCVVNNYIDRNIDKKMARTHKRALVQGTVGVPNALIYAAALGVTGFSILALYTNVLTVCIGAIGFIDYVVLYGIGKRQSVYGTLIGSIAGATPVLAGYTAVTNRLDAGGIIIFSAMVLWQMPHFYAIAMFRHNDYANAGIPVLPVVKGMHTTKIQILAYIAAFTGIAAALTLYGYTGYTYLLVMTTTGIIWLVRGIQTLHNKDDIRWGRHMFFLSLAVMLTFSAILAVGSILP